nr:MAG TPA: hypothetical protein [Caudoviricetes sp.]
MICVIKSCDIENHSPSLIFCKLIKFANLY